MQDEYLLKAKLQRAEAECERLRAENAGLKARLGDSPKPAVVRAARLSTSQAAKARPSHTVTNKSPAEQKVDLFRSLFRGREDVYEVHRGQGTRGGRRDRAHSQRVQDRSAVGRRLLALCCFQLRFKTEGNGDPESRSF